MIRTWLKFLFNVFIRKRQGKRLFDWREALGGQPCVLREGPVLLPWVGGEPRAEQLAAPRARAEGCCYIQSVTCKIQLFQMSISIS